MIKTELPPGRGASQSFPYDPAGFLFHKISLSLLGGALLLAAWHGQVGMVILLGLVFSAAGLAAAWSRVSLDGVTCQRSIEEKRLFPGEFSEVTLQITNRKPLPLPWIKVDDEIPEGLARNIPTLAGDWPGVRLLTRSASILWYSKAKWRCRLQGDRRGYYRIGPMRITSGDIFGFYPRWATIPLRDHIMVYPRIFPLDRLFPSLHPLGESKTTRPIFQDPTRILGLRDYRPEDSLKHIHWKASARHQNLQVKVFECTTTLKISLFLAVDHFLLTGSPPREDFELAISTAASLAYHLIEQGAPVGLFVNTCLADSGLAVSMAPGSTHDHLMEILEALAKVTPRYGDSFEAFLQGERRHLPSGSTLIFITSRADEPLLWLMNDLKEKGYRLLFLLIGDHEGTGPEGRIPTYRVRHPESLSGAHPGIHP
jgi:uncharacterized protein (DUF58 family)